MDFQIQHHIEDELNSKLAKNLNFEWQLVGGGSINTTYKISAKNYNYFVKVNDKTVFENGFNEEVLGLQFLKNKGAITPKIIIEGNFDTKIYLVLSWIDAAAETSQFWENFAHQLVDLHQHKEIQFGLEHPNYMGQLPQKNTFCNDFVTFFVENRLKPQVKLAFDTGALQTIEVGLFESLYKQLPSIFPTEKPSAIHGDLWSGNFIATSNNKAVFIDPAVYYGHREVDLAMSLLFGGFSNTFYTTYNEVYPLQKGFNNRKDIYNLYPLLIHLNMFGKSYLQSIKTIVSQF